MYYPIGLPKRLSFPDDGEAEIKAVTCNRDRILYAILTENSLWIWYSRPCVPLTSFKRSLKSLLEFGANYLVEWRPDSSMLVIATSKNVLLFCTLNVDSSQGESYEQVDSINPSLKRCSAELYSKEKIPVFNIAQVFRLDLVGRITSLVCLRDELMVATENGHLQRVKWDGTVNYDYCVDLSRVPFCDDQLVMKAVPLEVPGTGVHISQLEYSPLVGGFAIVLSDGRAAFLTATTLKFDPNAIQGIWAREVEDACCAAINHKYRLLAFGKANSEGIVMTVDEATGGLETCHRLVLSSKDFSGDPGSVCHMRWTPDGTVLGLCWSGGGFSLWSVFGSLLSTSLKWDYSEEPISRPIRINQIEWGAEGYEAWCIRSEVPLDECDSGSGGVSLPPFNPLPSKESPSSTLVTDSAQDAGSRGSKSNFTSLIQMSFVKSALTVNPCMSRLERVLLQGSDRLYLSSKESLEQGGLNETQPPYFYSQDEDDELFDETFQKYPKPNIVDVAASKQWMVVPIPYTYTASNWPIRYTCVDDEGQLIGVAGRNGVAHYSFSSRKWRLFGNENQEEDLVVTGGLMWWKDSHLVLGAYSIPNNADQVRFYPRGQKLDDEFAVVVPQPAQVLLLNIYCDQMIVLTADCRMIVYNITEKPDVFKGGLTSVSVSRIQEVDISGLTVHPACVVSISLTSLRTESWRSNSNQPVQPPAQSIIFNIAGKVLMIQRDRSALGASSEAKDQKLFESAQMTPIVLASCCESLWCASRTVRHKPHLSHALWIHCGAQGTRAWLPLFPSAAQDRGHTFMARRIMLPFTPSIYPLAVLFEDAIMIGAETDSSILACDNSTQYQPLVFVEKTSQVYLHHLLRQLLRRNLGYHAWEVANTCRNLPYFPHSLELLLHQVLEEEATSKDPIPDSLLPRVLDFIREFPVHLMTIVQCARKTELALWRYLFSVAGSPRHLFMQALNQGELDTAASYLIILQNLESAMVSRTYATKLLEATLEASKWELSKDLIRFLRSIDPNDLESPKSSPPINAAGTRIGFNLTTPPVSPHCADEDLSMIMPNTKALRGRSFSSASGPKAPGAAVSPETSSSFPHMFALRTVSADAIKAKGGSGGAPTPAEPRKVSSSSGRDVDHVDRDFLDVILQRRAKKLLLDVRLRDLGTMAAHLDFPLVTWLRRERLRAAIVDDFVFALRQIHDDFSWPFPTGAPGPGSNSDPPSANSDSSQLSSANEKMQRLSIVSPKPPSVQMAEIADSGYLSQCTQAGDAIAPLSPERQRSPPTSLEVAVARAAMLVPRQPGSPLSGNGDVLSFMSEEASLFDGESPSMSGAVEWGSDSVGDSTRNLLRSPDASVQPQPKPPPYAEVQLRYLLQIFLEAGCLELSIILAVLLRDGLAVLRVVGLARSQDTSAQVLSRLSHGLACLRSFADSQCLGYQNFLWALAGETSSLQRLSELRNGLAAPGSSDSPHVSSPASSCTDLESFRSGSLSQSRSRGPVERSGRPRNGSQSSQTNKTKTLPSSSSSKTQREEAAPAENSGCVLS